MLEYEAISDHQLDELKIQRYIENSLRLNVASVFAAPGVVAMEESVRLLVHGEAQMFMVWFGMVIAIGSLFLLPIVRRSIDPSARRRFKSMGHAAMRRWLDRPMRMARVQSVLVWFFPLWVISISAIQNDWGLNGLLISSFLAIPLIWGGLRWRHGDELVCARCEYPRTPESCEICPECGGAWTSSDGLALGRARPVAWMILSGSLALALDIFFVVSEL